MNCPLCKSNKKKSLTFKSTIVYMCKNCSLQYIDQQQSRSYYKNFHMHFDLTKSKKDNLRRTQYSIHAKHLIKNFPKGKILDVGCSTGKLLSYLIEKPEYQLFGIDPDENAISVARQKYGSKIQFFDGYLIDHNVGIKYDCLVFRGTFQYLGPHLGLTLKKIPEICTNKAKIMIYSLPNSDSFLYYFLKDDWHLFHKLEHTLIFNRRSLLKLCKIFGYKILELSYPYLETPYVNTKEDYENLVQLVRYGKIKGFPFWGNVMQVVLEKL